MKIGYILMRFPVLSETFIVNEIAELIDKGHEVRIFSLLRPTSHFVYPPVEQYELSRRVVSPQGRARLLVNLLNPLKHHLLAEGTPCARSMKSRLFAVGSIDRLTKTALEFGPDVVHSHFYGLPTLMGILLARRLGICSTFTVHAHDIFVDPKPQVLRKHMEEAKKIVTISNYNREYLTRITGVHEDRIRVVRACPRLEELKQVSRDEREYAILCGGRLVEKKGIGYAVLAMKEILKKFPHAELRIVGSGPSNAKLRGLVKSEHLENNVKLVGSVSRERYLYELSKATAFVLPCIKARNGDMDGIPVSLMEAMYLRIPVVSTRVSGIPELIDDGKQGFLAEPKDAGGVANAVMALFEDENLRRSMGAEGQRKIQTQFNIHTETQKLVEMWEEM